MPYSLERKDETPGKSLEALPVSPFSGQSEHPQCALRRPLMTQSGGCAVVPQGTYRLAERFPRGSGDLQAARSQLRLPEKSSYKGGLLMMSHASIVMVRCPATGRQL